MHFVGNKKKIQDISEKKWRLKKGNIENIFGSWVLKSYKKKKYSHTKLKNANININFSKNGISGNSGCNNYSFSIKSVGDTQLIVESGIFSTEMFCKSKMDLEETYMVLLGQAKSFDAYKDKLVIYCTEKNKLIFEKQKSQQSELNHKWILKSYGQKKKLKESVDKYKKPTVTFEENKLFGYAGPNFSDFSATYDIGKKNLNTTITIENMKYAMKKLGSPYPDSEELEQSNEFMKSLKKAESFKIEKNQLIIYGSEGNNLVFEKSCCSKHSNSIPKKLLE